MRFQVGDLRDFVGGQVAIHENGTEFIGELAEVGLVHGAVCELRFNWLVKGKSGTLKREDVADTTYQFLLYKPCVVRIERCLMIRFRGLWMLLDRNPKTWSFNYETQTRKPYPKLADLSRPSES